MLDYRIDTFLTLCESMNYRKTAEILMFPSPLSPSRFMLWKTSTGASCLRMKTAVW